MTFDFKPGSLVTLRNRPWVVLPSDDKDLLLLKPLGGSEDEITGIYKAVADEWDVPVSYDFVKPTVADLGDFSSARLLYNASRVAFRSAAGPFRCLGKLSFRPRSYQMVPLIMGLKQNIVRLLIADDVGVGKTIEGLLIAKELFERREIKRFAVVCLPHLCDQWQDELKSKFGLDAVIIRSGTATSLERRIRTNENIFEAFPFQIVSIDYIKTGTKRQIFINQSPELVIVDEAHTCARPAGANDSQQLRYHLLKDLSSKPNQHLILLTATPHSGKQEEFQSVLGLLDRKFENLDIVSASEADRRLIAKHFVQRRRADIVRWLDEETVFPERVTMDVGYKVGNEYSDIFNEILAYARETIAASMGDERKMRYSYWDVLGLLRGVMSSPSSGVAMLENKAEKKADPEEETAEDSTEDNRLVDNEHSSDDSLPVTRRIKTKQSEASESKRLKDYAAKLSLLAGPEHDTKLREAIASVQRFLEKGLNPIVYCRYLLTAEYVAENLIRHFKGPKYKKLCIDVVTSKWDDELRREKIEKMMQSERRLLIATDCLSEGINLQEGFNAILHYDLPWNPNRLEQREGRVDRFGQQSPVIEIVRLHGSNNPVDGVVLDVLYKKADEIRKSIGITVPIPEDSPSVMNAVMQAVLIRNMGIQQAAGEQLSLFGDEEYQAEIKRLTEREKVSRSIFAQNSIKAAEIEEDLKEVDEAIGNVQAVESFVTESLRFLGVQVDKAGHGHKIHTINIPQRLRELLTDKNEILVAFKSPTPAGYKYIGRNHPFTEQLSQTIIDNSLRQAGKRAARAAVLKTSDVTKKTVIFQLRVRNVIAEVKYKNEIVAEEMWLWGFRGDVDARDLLTKEEAMKLFMNAKASENTELHEQAYWLNEEMDWVRDEKTFRRYTDEVALARANHLVEAHTRFKKLVDSAKYKVVEPVLPVDVLGIYILLPVVK